MGWCAVPTPAKRKQPATFYSRSAGILGFQLGDAFFWRHAFMLCYTCSPSLPRIMGGAGENGVCLGSSSSVFR
jgi:hypothetical protein